MEASALILAAGAGTRMKSSKPKVAHQIFGKPLVRWVVDAAHAAGIDSVVGVVGHGREQVEPLLTDVTTVVQEEQLGTAHAVLAARGALEGRTGSLVVLTGDSPLVRAETIAELVRTREEANAAVVVLTMEAEKKPLVQVKNLKKYFNTGHTFRKSLSRKTARLNRRRLRNAIPVSIASTSKPCLLRWKKFPPTMRRANTILPMFWALPATRASAFLA